MTQASRGDVMFPSVVLGAGRQAEHLLRAIRWLGGNADSVVLFDDGYPHKRRGSLGNSIEGSLEAGLMLALEGGLPVMVGLGTRFAALRYALFQRLRKAGAVLPSLIHPSLIAPPELEIGPNTLIMAGCVLNTAGSLGALTTLCCGVTIDHDFRIGENVIFGTGATLAGNVVIGPHCFIGAGAVIGPEVTIGERVMVGAGALVMKDVEPGVVVYGVPARVHREVRPGDEVPTATSLRDALAHGPNEH